MSIKIYFTDFDNALHISERTHTHATHNINRQRKVDAYGKLRQSVDRKRLSDLCPWLFQPFAPPLLVLVRTEYLYTPSSDRTAPRVLTGLAAISFALFLFRNLRKYFFEISRWPKLHKFIRNFFSCKWISQALVWSNRFFLNHISARTWIYIRIISHCFVWIYGH